MNLMIYGIVDSYDAVDILILNSGGPAPGKCDDFETIDDFEEKSSMITFPQRR